jgi:hypothetical protein
MRETVKPSVQRPSLEAEAARAWRQSCRGWSAGRGGMIAPPWAPGILVYQWATYRLLFASRRR